MRICYIADARPHTHAPKWIRHFAEHGHEIHIISTYPADVSALRPQSYHVATLDFSARVRAEGATVGGGNGNGVQPSRRGLKARAIERLKGGLLWRSFAGMRDQTAPYMIARQKRRVRDLVKAIQPDIVHALRIPFEGLLAAEALRDSSVPLLISVWGNDFTLYAANSRRIAAMTRRAMQRADGLHPDCARDLELGAEYGFRAGRIGAVLPGNGGIRTDVFHPGARNLELARSLQIPGGAQVVINSRGIKPYIRNREFFAAIPEILKSHPNTLFLLPAMEDKQLAKELVQQHGVADAVRLLPPVSHEMMADLLRIADVSVSPADHDGTPNTLLESMTCGCFPIAGDIKSVSEWITDGVNGFLCDQRDPGSIARKTVAALSSLELRRDAAKRNELLISERADYAMCMRKAELLYQDVIASATL